MKRMNVIIFSHESDLDGVFSAAIGLIRYPQARTVFFGYGIESFRRMSSFIYSFTNSHLTKNSLVIISDLALNDDNQLIDLCKDSFSKAKEMGCRIIWVDHHPWPERAMHAITPFIEPIIDTSGRKCAAELMYENFLSGNSLAAKLASIARSMDFFTKDQYLTPISELIIYYHNLPGPYERLSLLARKVSRGVLWDTEMQIDYSEYIKIRDTEKLEAWQSMQIKEIKGGFRVAFIKSSSFLQKSLFSEEVFEKTNSDIVIFYSSEGKVSIRRNNALLSCRRIAANLPEGGGHEFAAGARLLSDPSNLEAVIEELQEAVVNSFQ